MQIDLEHFTPLGSLAGGLLIGAAASAFALLNGRIAGISGVLGGALRRAPGDLGWRLAFLGGLLAAAAALPLVPASAPQIEAGPGALVAAGLLVGVGTRLGNGCTSGHGVCGLSRRSPRSLVATLCFMATGFAAVFVARWVAR
jgi:hypothetical protein